MRFSGVLLLCSACSGGTGDQWLRRGLGGVGSAGVCQGLAQRRGEVALWERASPAADLPPPHWRHQVGRRGQAGCAAAARHTVGSWLPERLHATECAILLRPRPGYRIKQCIVEGAWINLVRACGIPTSFHSNCPAPAPRPPPQLSIFCWSYVTPPSHTPTTGISMHHVHSVTLASLHPELQSGDAIMLAKGTMLPQHVIQEVQKTTQSGSSFSRGSGKAASKDCAIS